MGPAGHELADLDPASIGSPSNGGTRPSPPILPADPCRTWLDDVRADDDLRATATGLRGFFLADPEELSLLALVDQFASDRRRPGQPVPDRRRQRPVAGRAGGDARRPAASSTRSSSPCRTADAPSTPASGMAGTSRRSRADYLVLALPATTLRRMPITPALPAQQHEAISTPEATDARPRRCCSSRTASGARPGDRALSARRSPFGAVWDGNEEQRGRAGILSLLAGGSASDATQAM